MNTEIKPKYLLESEDLVNTNIVTGEITTRPAMKLDEAAELEIKVLLEQQAKIDAKLSQYKKEIKDYIEATDKNIKITSNILNLVYKPESTSSRFDTTWAKTQPWYNEHLKESNVSSSLSIKLQDSKEDK